jgi:hypothetical protein
MQRHYKFAFSTVEMLFSAWPVQSGYKEESVEKSQSSFETPAWQDISLGAEE